MILPLLTYRSILGSPFCDYLNVTAPKNEGPLVLAALRPLLDVLQTEEVMPGVFRTKSGGTFKYYERGKVAVFSASGAFLGELRGSELLGEYLAVLASFPHRVSLIHVTGDFHSVPHEVVQAAKKAGQAGQVYLSRKVVEPKHCNAFLSVDSDGHETGTVYFGSKANADIWGKVYDKRHERLSRGYADPGPVVRVEVACQSDVGATLRDVLDPSALFWKYAGRSLVTPPPDVVPWEAHGEGFVLPRAKSDPTFLTRIDALLESDTALARAIDLAVGAYGYHSARDVLLVRFQRRLDVALRSRRLMAPGGVSIDRDEPQ